MLLVQSVLSIVPETRCSGTSKMQKENVEEHQHSLQIHFLQQPQWEAVEESTVCARSLSPEMRAWKINMGTMSIFFNRQEVAARKPLFRRAMFIYYRFVFWCGIIFHRFGCEFFIHPVHFAKNPPLLENPACNLVTLMTDYKSDRPYFYKILFRQFFIQEKRWQEATLHWHRVSSLLPVKSINDE